MFLLVSLVNCEDTPTTVRNLLDPSFGILQIEITGPDGETTRAYRPAVRREGRGAPSLVLQPGERVTVAAPVFFDRSGWVFRLPGTFTLRAEYPIGNIYVQAPAVELTVMKPRTEDEARAARRMMSDTVGLYLLTNDAESPGGGHDQARAVVDDFPQSPWADDLRWVLRASSGTSATDLTVEEISSPAISPSSDPILVARGIAVMLRRLGDVGRTVEAERVISNLDSRFPIDHLPTGLIDDLNAAPSSTPAAP